MQEVSMAESYYHSETPKQLRKLRQLKPDLFAAFVDFDTKVFQEGALSVKTKELIAIAAAHITQCPFCIDTHTRRAKKASATDTEIAEAIFVAMALRAGGSFAHGAIAMHTLEHEQK
jgi:AhpD family alkylhydroperoxidase